MLTALVTGAAAFSPLQLTGVNNGPVVARATNARMMFGGGGGEGGGEEGGGFMCAAPHAILIFSRNPLSARDTFALPRR